MPVTEIIHVVGTGSATMASITSTLCTGAAVPEAAQIGCLATAMTIKQISRTGTASREQITTCFEAAASEV